MTRDQKYMKAIAEAKDLANDTARRLDAFFAALHEKNANNIKDTEDALIETDNRIIDIEDALLELDVNGGATNG